MKINSLKLFSKILAALLLVSSGLLYSQVNNSNSLLKSGISLSHSINYYPQKNIRNGSPLFFAAAPDTLNVYAIMVQFIQGSNPNVTGNGRFDVSANYPDTVDAPPHDSAYFAYHLEFLKNYYYKASKGKLIVNYHIIGGVRTMSQTLDNYAPRPGENLSRLGSLFYEAWNSADSVVDFSTVNPNNSAFIIFHAGVGKDVDLISQGIFQGALDIPSIYLGASSLKAIYGDTTHGYYTKEGGVIISNSCILPEQEFRVISTSFGDQMLELGMNGIMVASIGSFLGLPDLFDTQTGRTAIGRFGLMDGQSIFSYLGVFPPEPSAWEKQYMGWVSPVIIGSDGNYTSLAASLDQNGNQSVYKVLISGKEYFLVENRNRDANNNGETIRFVKNGVLDSMNFPQDAEGFNSSDIWKLKGSIIDVDELDWSIPGLKNDTAAYQGGILIWHIDENVIDSKIGSNTINTDIHHRGVSVVEAKGSQDIGVVISTPLGDFISDGFFNDMWYNGNHYVPSTIYQNAFGPTTIPNSKSYSNINSRVCLNSFSGIGSSMTFTFQQCGSVANINGYPHFVGKDTSSNAQPIGIDFSRGENKEAVFININKQLHGFKYNGTPVDTNQPSGTMYGIRAGWIPGYYYNPFGSQHPSLVTSFDSLIEIRDFIITDSVSSSFGATVLNFNGNVFSSPAIMYDTNKIVEGSVSGKTISWYIRNFPPQFSSKVDSLSSLPIYEFSKSQDTTLNFIDSRYKYFAIGNIISSSSTDTVKITNDSKILLNGNLISANLGLSNIYSSPVIADINKDGKQEIIFTTDNKVYAINQNGVVIDNFPFTAPGVNSIASGCSVADLDGDGVNEVIFGTSDGRIYAYNTNGRVLDGFPLLTGSEIKSTPAIVNVAGSFGIIAYSQDGYLYGWKTQWGYDQNRVLWKNYLSDKYHSNSNFSVSQFSVTQPCLPKDKVYNWPNPANGSTTNIRYYLGGDASSVNIKIMDLSGELVTTLQGTTFKGFDNEVPWDITKVQSGIYIAVVQLVGGCGETASIKIAVVK